MNAPASSLPISWKIARGGLPGFCRRGLLCAHASGQGPVVGYPVIKLPLDIEAHVSQRVEVRLELALPGVQMTADNPPTRPIASCSINCQARPPSIRRFPRCRCRNCRRAPEPPQLPAEDVLLANALTSLQGFELVDEDHGIHIVFPRGW